MITATYQFGSRRKFKRLVRNPAVPSIEGDERLRNLAGPHWVYEELLTDLARSGWRRFAAGYKYGVLGHPDHAFCIKLLGWGVGDNPKYFCERGYYVEHERAMLRDFRDAGFEFAPAVLTQDESVAFLRDVCGVRTAQAEMRVSRNDLLITEFIPGMSFGTSTGHGVDYDVNVAAFDHPVLEEMLRALLELRGHLARARTGGGLVQNDPMPPNIVFTLGGNSRNIQARLVDFELAQNLSKTSPEYINHSIRELYTLRDVPRNSQTGQHTSNLDQHILDQSITALRDLISIVRSMQSSDSLWDWFTIRLPQFTLDVNLGRALRYLARRMS